MQLYCRYPTTVFDPRPLISSSIANDIYSIQGRVFLQIIFACKQYSVEYEPVLITGAFHETKPKESHHIYSFWPDIPLGPSRTGKEVTVCEVNDQLSSFLNKFKKGFLYEQTFSHPSSWDERKGSIPDPSFIPLLENINHEIVAFSWGQENLVSFVFPDVSRKAEFLTEFLQEVAPIFFPEIFPYSTEFKWIEEPACYLPGHQSLLEEKDKAQKAFKDAMDGIEKRMDENTARYAFLHQLVIETGNALVRAVHVFLQWLEFKRVTIMDEKKSGVLEEDIQIEYEKGIIVMEVKGIGGTSTDSDCSQIAKIRTRRFKQRNALDVTAVYLVNHQRHLPPEVRQNPPFTEHQIRDAEYDERGLLTTWQLFLLYRDIQDGILTKADARNAFLQPGLIIFRPKVKNCLGKPSKLYEKGHIAIFDLAAVKLQKGQTLIAEKNDRYGKVTIQSIQVAGKHVDKAEKEEVGIKLDVQVDDSTTLWTL